ncbi:MAG: terminase family protein [Patescibacteria group bacterium]|nr:terminase family protein [Patescibacteria group bacterium]
MPKKTTLRLDSENALPANLKRLIEWQPNPGPQTMLFYAPSEIVLYGGAKGGGKTEALIMMMLRDYDKDGYRGIIIRRNYTELERHIIPQCRHLLKDIGRYNEKTHRWTFQTPNGGESSLEFGYLESPADLENYQGSQYSRIGFDESTSFVEEEIRTMYACLRSVVPGVKRQLILTCNPIGRGFQWHKQLFIEKRTPYTIYEDARWPSDGRPVGASTIFIPATVWDNPKLLTQDPNYPDRLRSQFGPVTEALLNGSWNENLYLAFAFDTDQHVVDDFELPSDARRWMACDWGVEDKAATVWMAEVRGRVYLYREHIRPGRDIVSYASEIASMCRDEKIDYLVLSHECFNRRGTINTQADLFRNVLAKRGIQVTPSDKDAAGRLTLLREYLRTQPLRPHEVTEEFDYHYWLERMQTEGRRASDELAHLQSLLNNQVLPKLQVFRSCQEFIHLVPLLVVDKQKKNVLASGQDDHIYDAAGYALKSYMGHVTQPTRDVYDCILEGRVPQTPMQADFAWREAQRIAGNSDEEALPVSWPIHHRVPK